MKNTGWKRDITAFGMNPPEFGGFTKVKDGTEYYVGAWDSEYHLGYFVVVLGRFDSDEDVIVKGRKKVKKREVQSVIKKYMTLI